MAIVSWAVNLTLIYAAVGLVFAVLFASLGVQRVDPAAKGAPWTFRLLIIPGVAALWPLLLMRMKKARGTRG